MTSDSKTTGPEGGEPPRFGIGSFLFAVVLLLIFFLLVQNMVRHRFFRGGRIDRNGHHQTIAGTARNRDGLMYDFAKEAPTDVEAYRARPEKNEHARICPTSRSEV